MWSRLDHRLVQQTLEADWFEHLSSLNVLAAQTEHMVLFEPSAGVFRL